MSHITTIDLKIMDLDALEKACGHLGLELKRGQKTFKWFGRWMGDTVNTTGIETKDFGQCEHAISVKNNAGAYEAGLVRNGTGYKILFDFWAGGQGLMEKIGYDGTTSKNADKLRDWYAAEVSAKAMKKKGFTVKATQQSRKVEVLCRKS